MPPDTALRWSSENGGSRRTRRWAMIHTRHRRRRTPSSGSASATRTRHGPPSGAFTPGSRSARSSPISRRRDASRRPPRRWGKTPAVTMPHLGGLPASRIREVRMQNCRVGPPPLGGWEVAGRRAGPGSGPPVLVRRVVSRLRLGSAWVLPFRLSGEVASSRASSGYGYLTTQCTRQSQA